MNVHVLKFLSRRYYSTFVRKPFTILGIETSCDDTGCAIINSERKILSEYVQSYNDHIIRLGGIVPNVIRDFHKSSIVNVVNTTLENANMTMNDIDAVAVTTRPGLALSLCVGLNYAKTLVQQFKKSIIPIHHMEAHALTARLFNQDIEYPFLTLLISGGHCLIAYVKSVNEFIILGHNTDDAPGEVLDKIARRLKLHNLPKYKNFSGGAAIEDIAKTGNTAAFEFRTPFSHMQHCNFSFAGFKTQAMKYILQEENKFGIEGDAILPNSNDICASIQYAFMKHILKNLQRAITFIDLYGVLPSLNKRFLVISGGAACNSYFLKGVNIICETNNYETFVPPTKYCCDNGVMIAWNGIERCNAGLEMFDYDTLDSIDVVDRMPLGEDMTDRIRCERIKSKLPNLDKLESKISSS